MPAQRGRGFCVGKVCVGGVCVGLVRERVIAVLVCVGRMSGICSRWVLDLVTGITYY